MTEGRENRDRAWRSQEREDYSGYCDELEDEDYPETCRDCGTELDDGEGYDGRCGECADAVENRKHAPAIDAHLEMALKDSISGVLDVEQEPYR